MLIPKSSRNSWNKKKSEPLSYVEKLEINKMIESNLLNKSEICEKWSISRSTISRIIKEFESKKSPHYSQVRPLPLKKIAPIKKNLCINCRIPQITR